MFVLNVHSVVSLIYPPRVSVPSCQAINLRVRNFEATASTTKKQGGSVKTSSCTLEKIERTRKVWLWSPIKSARRHSIQLGTLRSVLTNYLHYHPYKMQIVQALKPHDYIMRLSFCQAIGTWERVNNLWMSDKTHIHLSDFANKQNFRYWSWNNSNSLCVKPLYSEKVIVWCAMSHKVLGP